MCKRERGRDRECTCVNAHEFSALGDQKKVLDSPTPTPGSWSYRWCELPDCWEQHSIPLEEQQVLLTSKKPGPPQCHPLPSICPLWPLLSALDGLVVTVLFTKTQLLQAGGFLCRMASEGTILGNCLLRKLQHLVTTHGQAAGMSWIPIHGVIISTLQK